MKTKLLITAICISWALNAFSQCTVSLTTTNTTCNGICDGVITATASGGTPPYTYLWNMGATSATITGLCAGVYSITITDAIACTATASAAISQPVMLLLSTSTTPACGVNNDGTATVNPSGGTPPYTYVWNSTPAQSTQTAVNLSAANFTVTVSDANGCTATAIVTITTGIRCWDTNGNGINDVAEDLNADGFWDALDCVSSPVSICAGQCATLSTAGVATYWWNPSGQTTASIVACPTVTTTYTVMIADANGCNDTATTTVTVYPVPVVTLAGNITICMGQSATLCASGGTFYSWSIGATTACILVSPTATTTYTVVASNGGCSDTASIIVAVDSLNASLILTPDTANPLLWYGYPTITGTAPFTYYWDFGDGNNSTQPAPSHTYTVAGNYIICLTVTDANGCISSICDTTYKMSPSGLMQTLIVVNPLTGTSELTALQNISIYPNPFSTQTTLQIEVPLKNATLTVYNLQGQTVKQYNNITGHSFTLSRDNLPSGLYFIRLSTPSPSGGGTQGGGSVIATGKLVIADK
ncbi:MAG: PKD domain-containing protein [Bacteroidetes bacterium]|nr:PKD domain-containing protein [Bacteroidota bacterium]